MYESIYNLFMMFSNLFESLRKIFASLISMAGK